MAATIIINELNGSSATKTNKTNGTIRFKRNDTPDENDFSAPLVKPTSGVVYSMKKYLRLQMTAAPSGAITNVRFYGVANPWGTSSGIQLYFMQASAYTTPAIATSADVTSASPISATSTVIGAGPYTTTGDMANYVILFVTIDSTVAAPTITSKTTLTFAYDEV